MSESVADRVLEEQDTEVQLCPAALAQKCLHSTSHIQRLAHVQVRSGAGAVGVSAGFGAAQYPVFSTERPHTSVASIMLRCNLPMLSQRAQAIPAAAEAAGYAALCRCLPLLEELLGDAEADVRSAGLRSLVHIGACLYDRRGPKCREQGIRIAAKLPHACVFVCICCCCMGGCALILAPHHRQPFSSPLPLYTNYRRAFASRGPYSGAFGHSATDPAAAAAARPRRQRRGVSRHHHRLSAAGGTPAAGARSICCAVSDSPAGVAGIGGGCGGAGGARVCADSSLLV